MSTQPISYPDRSKVDYLITGRREGFHIGFHADNVKLKSATVNCPSANAHPEVIDTFLFDEINAGRIFGPTSTPPLPNLHLTVSASFLRKISQSRGV